ncbi:hypothetical protein PIB30_053526 [Stylosanthes scabra]|uniref:Leucine-rich repeat-containing N-terminal plant-type domain-containing protein n=1 Tax=Stylosanthes scabra TaxID=79078 RepID=A0ABU6VH20_9FABA|nr:hypothetical protein [Stylosanthes scabra]
MILIMEQQQQQQRKHVLFLLLLLLMMSTLCFVVLTETDPSDVKVLNQFRSGLKNPDLLPWPENGGDPCGNPPWKFIFCNGKRVSQIQAKNLNLIGPLPESFNQLTMLENLGLQNNNLNGPLPSFSGLKMLKLAFLNHNEFDSIPYDFFDGLESLEVLALDYNTNLNASNGGWKFPLTLQGSTQLTNISCMSCNMVGPIPEFLGTMVSLSVLQLSGNNLSGAIPASFEGIGLQILWLNNQHGGGLGGTIDVVETMASFTSLWLHGNNFNGTIHKNIGDLASLKDLNLNGNQLVGVIPDSLGKLQLENLDLNNNHFMGPIPEFVAPNKVTFDSNNFCETKPGVSCSFEVMALIEFLSGLDYPLNLVNSWVGDNPCEGPWLGIKCNYANGKVSMIILSNFNLIGTLSPSVAKLDSLVEIRLGGNRISGVVPSNWTSLRSLKLLDLSGNNISGPLPSFDKSLKIVIDGSSLQAPSSSSSSSSSLVNRPSPSSGRGELSSVDTPLAPSNSKRKNLVLVVAPIAGVVAAIFMLIPIYLYCFKGRNEEASKGSSSLVVHPRDPSDSDNVVKLVVASNGRSISTRVSGSGSRNLNTAGNNAVSHVIEAGNLVISVQVLRDISKNFAPENELGRGGFGGVFTRENWMMGLKLQ